MNEFQPQDRVTTHFDQAAHVYASWYDRPDPEGHSFRIRRMRCMELLRTLPPGSRIADIGCGPATFVEALLRAGYDVLATDIAPQMIEDGRQRFSHEPRVRFEIAPADHIPTPDNTLDAVTAMGLVEYLNDEEAVYREAWRALKPGGRLIVTYPQKASPTRAWNRLTHAIAVPILRIIRRGKAAAGVKHREYDPAEAIRAVERAGFNVTDVIFYNFKLGFRPLDRLFPSATVWVAEHLERYARTPILRRIGTGFILTARKP